MMKTTLISGLLAITLLSSFGANADSNPSYYCPPAGNVGTGPNDLFSSSNPWTLNPNYQNTGSPGIQWEIEVDSPGTSIEYQFKEATYSLPSLVTCGYYGYNNTNVTIKASGLIAVPPKTPGSNLWTPSVAEPKTYKICESNNVYMCPFRTINR